MLELLARCALAAPLAPSPERETVSIEVTEESGRYVIRSPGIEAQVSAIEGLVLPEDDTLRSAWLLALAAYKDAEERLVYGRTASELQQRAIEEGYLGSEQHQVYAYIASARSGFRIPPSYFLDIEPFGGTAGSGLEIVRGGRTGELLSTIALAHDVDWFYGRYLAVGPLAALAEVPDGDPVYLALVGLVDARHAALWAKASTRNPLYPRPTESERHALDSTALYLGTRGATRFALASDNPAGLEVRFTEAFVRASNGGRLRSRTPLPLRSVPFPETLLLREP